MFSMIVTLIGSLSCADKMVVYCYVPKRGILVDIKLHVFTVCWKLLSRPEVSLLLSHVVETIQQAQKMLGQK